MIWDRCDSNDFRCKIDSFDPLWCYPAVSHCASSVSWRECSPSIGNQVLINRSPNHIRTMQRDCTAYHLAPRLCFLSISIYSSRSNPEFSIIFIVVPGRKVRFMPSKPYHNLGIQGKASFGLETRPLDAKMLVATMSEMFFCSLHKRNNRRMFGLRGSRKPDVSKWCCLAQKLQIDGHLLVGNVNVSIYIYKQTRQ